MLTPPLLSKMQQEALAFHQALDLGGTVRSRTIEETFTYLQPLFKKVGITRVADIGGLDVLDLPVATAIRPNARHLCGAQGKGLTRELARISAIVEAIESYHMEHPPTPELTGSYAELQEAYPLVDLTTLPLGKIQTGDLQHAHLEWNSAVNLMDGKHVYLPHALINLNSSEPTNAAGLFAVSTNGLAGGNTLNEAICHALYELIERDAVWHWLQKSRQERDKTKLDLQTIPDEKIQGLIEKFTRAKLAIDVWEIPSVIELPVYYCITYDKSGLSAGGSFYGSGCHLIRAIALSRSITEAAQSRAGFISGSRDDIYPKIYQQQRVQQKKILTNPQPAIANGVMPLSISEVIKHSFNLLDNIKAIIQALKIKGYSSVLVVDHTKPEFNFPVVQVFIPGFKDGARGKA